MQDFFFVYAGKKYVKIKYSELIFVRSHRNYKHFVTESKTYFVIATMTTVRKCLPKELFCRINTSHFLAVDRIQSFDNNTVWLTEPKDGKQYIAGLANTRSLRIGPRFIKNLKMAVNYMPGFGARNTSEFDKAILEFALKENLAGTNLSAVILMNAVWLYILIQKFFSDWCVFL